MKDSLYHILLRCGALTLALLLLFDSGLLSPITKQLSEGTQDYVATVISVGAAVEPTELNSITAQLSAKERELDAREAALSEREIPVRVDSAPSAAPATDFSTYILSVLLFIIIVLIVLNYALDFARERRLLHNAKPGV